MWPGCWRLYRTETADVIGVLPQESSLMAKTDFTANTGIDVEIVLRTDTKETELTRLVSAVQVCG